MSSNSGGPSPILVFLRERYGSFDRRILGLFRIYFGLLLLVDVLRRIPVATFLYSNDGVLSNHYSLFAPLIRPYFSVYTAFSTPNEVRTLMWLSALVYCFYIVGWRTKIWQVAAIVLYTGLNLRNGFVENGGCVVVSILCVWTVFLPLGDRFSIDAVTKSMRARRDRTANALNDREAIKADISPFHTIVATAIMIEIAAIYFFNTVHKTGETWKNGEAIHWVLWQNRIATHLCEWVRMHEPSWLSPLFSKAALVTEFSCFALVLSPVFQKWTRLGVWLLACSLHLSIAALMTLGPFSYVMIGLTFLLVPGWVPEWIGEKLNSKRVARTVVVDATDPGLFLVARVLSRLDVYHRLTFIDAADEARRPEGTPKAVFAAKAEGGEWQLGTAGIVEAARSLPMGPFWVLKLGNPLGAAVLRALLTRRKHLAAALSLPAGKVSVDGPEFELADAPTPLAEQWFVTRSAIRESLATIVLIAVVCQLSHDNWWLPPKLKLAEVPQMLRPIIDYPHIVQGWSMFSPDAPKTDGLLVIDGVTADGRHLDPFTGKAPDFEAPLHGPFWHTQLECDYHLKMSFDGNKGYREEFKQYLLRWAQVEGRPPQDRLVSFDVYWVSNDSPPPGKTVPTNIQRRLLFNSRLSPCPASTSPRPAASCSRTRKACSRASPTI
jgi:hypothetical protein